jgi:ABC-type Mn2+/Zn2+ transport system ATPase subunit
MSGDVLVIEGLTAARGGRIIVHEVSLEIPGGTVTTLLGPNGGVPSRSAARGSRSSPRAVGYCQT